MKTRPIFPLCGSTHGWAPTLTALHPGCGANHVWNEPQHRASLAWAGLVSTASSGPPSPVKL